MNLKVERVHIPRWSSIGYGWGRDEGGDLMVFVGDHRLMRSVGEALGDGGTIDVYVEPAQVLGPYAPEEVA